jgi:hypothetical protein
MFLVELCHVCWLEREELPQFIQQEGNRVLFRCLENNVEILNTWIYSLKCKLLLSIGVGSMILDYQITSAMILPSSARAGADILEDAAIIHWT